MSEVQCFDYRLPRELIAQEPSERRDESRLLVLHRKSGEIEHRQFREILNYLGEGDILVLNDTRVLFARLVGWRETGGRVGVLLLPLRGTRHTGGSFRCPCLLQSRGKLKEGERIKFPRGVEARYEGRDDEGRAVLLFHLSADSLLRKLEEVGYAPLPPYIKRRYTEGGEVHLMDKERYQTVYAKRPGAIAAPTAGLHFTEELLTELKEKGVRTAFVTLHTGPGTFMPVRTKFIENHRMESEYYEVEQSTLDLVQSTRMKGGRVVAVGTTTVRVLETVALSQELRGWTELFIYPPYEFKLVDALITNFHLPRSTLLMLVCAFAGQEFVLRAYEEAVKLRYRFYSYGDAMLLL